LDTIERVVGRHVAAARNRAGWSQAELAAVISRNTRRRWSRESVANAEAGSRGFAVADLWTFAIALNTSAGSLLTPDASDRTVDVSGVAVRADRLRTLGTDAAGWVEEALVTGGSKVIERATDAMTAIEAFADEDIPNLLQVLEAVQAEGEQLKKLAGSRRKRKERKA
jgi:transcriptional regulator with XRE-family HTH domain